MVPSARQRARSPVLYSRPSGGPASACATNFCVVSAVRSSSRAPVRPRQCGLAGDADGQHLCLIVEDEHACVAERPTDWDGRGFVARPIDDVTARERRAFGRAVPLIRRTSGSARCARAMCAGESVSPPTNRSRTPASASGRVSTIVLKKAAVSQRHSMSWRRIVRAMASGAGISSPSNSTQQPPRRSGTQRSNVDASNASGDSWRKRPGGRPVMRSRPWTRRITARWGTATPFGCPVDPEVYMMYARASPAPAPRCRARPPLQRDRARRGR